MLIHKSYITNNMQIDLQISLVSCPLDLVQALKNQDTSVYTYIISHIASSTSKSRVTFTSVLDVNYLKWLTPLFFSRATQALIPHLAEPCQCAYGSLPDSLSCVLQSKSVVNQTSQITGSKFKF